MPDSDIVWEGQFGEYAGEGGVKKRDQEFVFSRLGTREPKSLYRGIAEYSQMKPERIDQYYINSRVLNLTIKLEEKSSPTFFRDRLRQYIETHPITPYVVESPDIRSTSPEQATITMEALLGEEGVALYQLAIEEERFSKEFVNAVFAKSTVKVEGAIWDKRRPIITVAGPSSSGKSVAAQAVLEQANRFMPKKQAQSVPGAESEPPAPQETNYAVFSDGGIERELSQVRKIAIQLALRNGYTGVSDLEKMSEVKNKVKTCVFNEVKASQTLGLVIPETFAGLRKGVGALKELQKDPRNVVIFSRVDGEKPSTFKKVVAYLGTRRAFKSSGFDASENNDISYNKEGLPESKAYGVGGFYWGVRGSKKAESQFIASQKGAIGFIVTNDLVLKKQDNSDEWIDGKEGDSDLVLVSNRVFQTWKESREGSSRESLEAFKKTKPAKPMIHTYGQRDLLRVQITAEKSLAEKSLADIDNQEESSDKENKFRVALEKILEVMPEELKEGGLQIDQQKIDTISVVLSAYRNDLGEKMAAELDVAVEKLSTEARLATFGVTPSPPREVTPKPILVDVRGVGDFTIKKLKTSSDEYKKSVSSPVSDSADISTSQHQGKELYYEGHIVQEDERIVAELTSEQSTVRLEQEQSGKVTDRSSGQLSDLDRQKAALVQAQMVLNNYDPKNGKIVIQGKDPEQAQRVYAALMHLASNNPDLKKKMKSRFGYSPEKILECRVAGFKPPKELGGNSAFINRNLPDLKTISQVSDTESMSVIAAEERRKIEAALTVNPVDDKTKSSSSSFQVLKGRYKAITVERARDATLDSDQLPVDPSSDPSH